ncbi:MAG: hypothetical protein JWQ78_651 [Sediminibacterium sp.]|nr:hypothetical protein [Sediminibacterium sp.]
MMPQVLLMAIHINPTESVFTIRRRYSFTPGSTAMIVGENDPYKITEDLLALR